MNSLNDFFISRDVVGYLQTFIKQSGLSLPLYEQKLDYLSAKQHMSFAQWWRLLEELEALTPYDALGLQIGRYIKVEHVGVLGYLFRTARNVGEALACFKRFQGLIYAGSLAHTELNPDNSFCLVWNPDYGYSSQCSDELLLSAMVTIVNEIIFPKKLNLSAIHFTQALSDDRAKSCKNYFCCPVYSQQEKLSIAFSVSDLDIPIPHSDITLHGILGKQAEDLLISLPDCDTFIAELTDTIIRCLHEGDTDTNTVASRINMSERTLHRRLKSKGKVFRDILQEIRKSMVINYLKDPKLTLSEIALLLGYSEQSSFTRAFSTWYKCSPLQYQKRYLS